MNGQDQQRAGGNGTPGNETGTEPSTFELDVYWASGRPEGSAIAAHVASCARCRAHLEHLEALGAAAPPAPAAEVPPHEMAVRTIVTSSARGGRARRWPRAWMAPAAGVLALAAGVLLLLRRPSPGYVGTKGTPAIELLVHRDQDTHVWDGRSAVRPGDTLALRVACEGLAKVAVAAPRATEPGGWARLSDAPCPVAGDLLPFTLVVDAEPGDEDLAVVLSDASLDDAALASAIGREERSGSVWVTSLHLPKSVTDR